MEELQRDQDPALGQLAPIPDHLFAGIPIYDAERRQQILAAWRDTMRPDEPSETTSNIPSLEEGEVAERPETPPPVLRVHNESATTLPTYKLEDHHHHELPQPLPPAMK
jgi:hypothetical protein